LFRPSLVRLASAASSFVIIRPDSLKVIQLFFQGMHRTASDEIPSARKRVPRPRTFRLGAGVCG
jgi:hypothetical protein